MGHLVAVDWSERKILLGEVKWSRQPVGRGVVDELVAKTDKVVPAGDWEVCYGLFARAGFTDAARAAAQDHRALLIELEQLDKDLGSPGWAG